MNQAVKTAKRRAEADPDRQGSIIKGRYYGTNVPLSIAGRSPQPGCGVKSFNPDTRTTRGACA